MHRGPRLQPHARFLKLLRAVHRTQPPHPILDPNLPLRLQLRLMQMKIIHCSQSQFLRSGVSHSIHNCSTCGAKVVCHDIPRGDGLGLTIGRQVILAADVSQVRGKDREDGGEHGGCDFATVGAVAEKGGEENGRTRMDELYLRRAYTRLSTR
jgi:hypothetical protein